MWGHPGGLASSGSVSPGLLWTGALWSIYAGGGSSEWRNVSEFGGAGSSEGGRDRSLQLGSEGSRGVVSVTSPAFPGCPVDAGLWDGRLVSLDTLGREPC